MVDSKDCIFCRIVRGGIPCKKVFEDSESFAFLDINPRNPGHALVIPKKHAETLLDMDEEDSGVLFMNVRRVAAKVMAATKAQGISISQSNGAAAGQVVSHVHFHVIPRFANEGPPGLETMLGAKRMDEKALDQIAASIRNASAEDAEAPKPAPKPAAAQAPRQVNVSLTPRGPVITKDAKKPEKRGFIEDDEDDIDDEEIDENMFNF